MVDGVKIKAPKAIESPQPEYPREAGKEGIRGTATVAVTIGTNGRVENAELLRDPGHGLGTAALEAALRWRFEPPIEDGRPVRVTMVLTFGVPAR
jgi:TonB family protein